MSKRERLEVQIVRFEDAIEALRKLILSTQSSPASALYRCLGVLKAGEKALWAERDAVVESE